jgi:DNA-nicking Smr family endonuclease
VRRRRLTAEETELWRRLARTVTPLDRTRPLPPSAPAPEQPPPSASPAPAAAARAKPPRSEGHAALPHHGNLDRRTTQRLRRGRVPLDARFDLHGHTQASAHAALLAFLTRARERGHRHVLVVTGRGSEGGGILKRSVPRWLLEPAFQRHVVAFHEAGPQHGGGGALYVVLRRARG